MGTRSRTEPRDERLAAVVPGYVRESDSPAALLTRLQRVVIFLEKLQEEAVAGVDLSYPDFVILATLRMEPPPHALPVSRLAQYVLRPMGSITQAVDRVERRGLVTRGGESSDRRRVMVSLTPKGARVAAEAQTAYDAIRSRIFDRLDGGELATIDASVRLLLDALEADHWEQQR
jgi:DNA-binding MarR family transcriptional regulator